MGLGLLGLGFMGLGLIGFMGLGQGGLLAISRGLGPPRQRKDARDVFNLTVSRGLG